MKQNLKKVKHSWPPKNRVYIRRSSWSSFESFNSLKKKKVLKKFDFNSHGKKVEVGNRKKKVPIKEHKKAIKPLNATKKPAKRLNKDKKTKKKFKFGSGKFYSKNIIIISIEYLSLGMTLYFIFKNLLDLSIKHLVFLLMEPNFNLEFLLLCIFGFFQSAFLSKCLLDQKKNSYTNKLYCICFSIQVLMLASIGCVQFLYGMTIWDHKNNPNSFFLSELVKYIFELFFLTFFCLFKYLKLFGKIKSKD